MLYAPSVHRLRKALITLRANLLFRRMFPTCVGCGIRIVDRAAAQHPSIGVWIHNSPACLTGHNQQDWLFG